MKATILNKRDHVLRRWCRSGIAKAKRIKLRETSFNLARNLPRIPVKGQTFDYDIGVEDRGLLLAGTAMDNVLGRLRQYRRNGDSGGF